MYIVKQRVEIRNKAMFFLICLQYLTFPNAVQAAFYNKNALGYNLSPDRYLNLQCLILPAAPWPWDRLDL
jgi:hypothetical protein